MQSVYFVLNNIYQGKVILNLLVRLPWLLLEHCIAMRNSPARQIKVYPFHVKQLKILIGPINPIFEFYLHKILSGCKISGNLVTHQGSILYVAWKLNNLCTFIWLERIPAPLTKCIEEGWIHPKCVNLPRG